MMNFLRKHMRKIFIVTILAFIGGIFMGGGAYLFGPSDYKTAAAVNGGKIPMNLFSSVYNNAVEAFRQNSQTDATQEELNEIKVKILQALVQDELFYQQAKKYDIMVSDAELTNDLQSSMLFRNNNVFDIRMYHNFLRSMRMTPKEYEALRRKQIAGEKLKILLASAIKVSESEFAQALKNDKNLSREAYIQSKVNYLLNEWYLDIARNSKITSSDMIFKQ